MAPLVRNILAVVAGLLVGSAVNMALVLVSGSVVPPPDGADVTTPEGLAASIHLFEPKHFVMPFLAHALGTLVGAVVATALAATRRPTPSRVVAGFFLLGGLANAAMLPAPMWFEAVDLVAAYLPMAWLGHRIAARKG